MLDFQLDKEEERANKQRLLETQTATHKHNLELAEHQLKLQKSEKEGTFSKFSEDFSFSYVQKLYLNQLPFAKINS